MSPLDHWMVPRSRWARGMERLSLWVERPANRLIGNRQLNPFYHTGPIASLLMGIVALTGIYLFLFFQYGFEASYNSVVTRIEGPPIARVMRAMHRYASGALVITTFLHAWRILFMERFRGPRRLAWITGIVMTFILWVAGVTGYWLVQDQRAQAINDHFITFLEQLTPWADRYRLLLLRAEAQGTSWQLLLVLLGVHVLLFVVVALFFWLHVRHLQRPRWLPELHWLAGIFAVLIVISALFPAGNLPPANPDQLPGPLRLDPVFLYYLPLNETRQANLLWLFMWVATAVALTLPWWRTRTRAGSPPPVIEISADRCTGCSKCATDCPYGALTMVQRQDDGSGHPLLAVADTSRCVGCGICIGSCDGFLAITLPPTPPEAVWQTVQQRLETAREAAENRPIKLILTCERHAAQGAAPFLPATSRDDLHIAILALPCTGAVQPHILPRALQAGAAEVQIVGCPPFDCKNREGNLQEAQRITNERVPRLRKRYDDAPITAAWLPPDQFAESLALTVLPESADPSPSDDSPPESGWLASRAILEWLQWRNLLAGFGLLGLVLLSQIWFTGLRFVPHPDPPALIDVALANPLRAAPPAAWVAPGSEPVTMRLEIDGQQVWAQVYTSADFFAMNVPVATTRLELPPGTYAIRFAWGDPATNLSGTLFDRTVTLQAGDILRLNDILPSK
jgi:ferredoxin